MPPPKSVSAVALDVAVAYPNPPQSTRPRHPSAVVCTATLTSSGCAGSLSTSMTMPAGQRDAPPAVEEEDDEDEDAPVPSADAAAVVGCTATGRYLRGKKSAGGNEEGLG